MLLFECLLLIFVCLFVMFVGYFCLLVSFVCLFVCCICHNHVFVSLLVRGQWYMAVTICVLQQLLQHHFLFIETMKRKVVVTKNKEKTIWAEQTFWNSCETSPQVDVCRCSLLYLYCMSCRYCLNSLFCQNCLDCQNFQFYLLQIACIVCIACV